MHEILQTLHLWRNVIIEVKDQRDGTKIKYGRSLHKGKVGNGNLGGVTALKMVLHKVLLIYGFPVKLKIFIVNKYSVYPSKNLYLNKMSLLLGKA